MKHHHFLLLLALVGVTVNYGVVEAYSNGAAPLPRVIQGGMGIRISKWELAREVAKQGQLGVVSGTVIDTVLVRELQNGDPEGSMRRALASFPDQGMSQRIMDKYY